MYFIGKQGNPLQNPNIKGHWNQFNFQYNRMQKPFKQHYPIIPRCLTRPIFEKYPMLSKESSRQFSSLFSSFDLQCMRSPVANERIWNAGFWNCNLSSAFMEKQQLFLWIEGTFHSKFSRKLNDYLLQHKCHFWF